MVEESKKDPMHAVYEPRVITKESILTASASQMEMLLQHVVLVKDPVVQDKFKPRYISLFHLNPPLQFTQTTIKANAGAAESSPDVDIAIVGQDGNVEPTPTVNTR